jgi:hypothetical protein
MTPERIEKAAQLDKLYAAMASGETLQVFKTDTAKWWDITVHDGGPNLHSELKWWRIKPKPRRFWIQTGSPSSVVYATDSESIKDRWINEEFPLIEAVEVLP